MKPLSLCLLVAVTLPFPANAQDTGGAGTSSDEITRKLADSSAAMVSVPFQYHYLGEVGPDGGFHNQVLKIQPVIPFAGKNGKFILGPILPLLSNQSASDKSGIGDLLVLGDYIPNRGGVAVEFGFGPVAAFDTASDESVGSGKWSIGPAFAERAFATTGCDDVRRV